MYTCRCCNRTITFPLLRHAVSSAKLVALIDGTVALVVIGKLLCPCISYGSLVVDAVPQTRSSRKIASFEPRSCSS